MTDSHKLAALRLSGLSQKDREWILSRLPVTDQEKIADLIDEVGKFGIDSSDENLLKMISGNGNKTNQKLATLNEESPRCTIINNAEVQDIINVLNNLPDEITATILSERSWKWEQDFMLSKGSKGFEQLKSLKKKESKLGDRAKAVLIECLAAELDPTTEQGDSFDDFLMAQNKQNKKGLFSRRGKQ